MIGGDAGGALRRIRAVGFEMHAPPLTLALDPQHFGLGEDLRAVIGGIGQVVHQRGVLRADIAARYAIPAIGAGRLRHAELIGLVFESDVDRRLVETLAHFLGRMLQRVELAERGIAVGIGVGREHFAGALIIGVDLVLVLAECSGPMRLVEQALVEFERDIGIDQRGPPEPAADQRILIVVHMHFEQGVGRTDPPALGVDLHGVLRVGKLVRIFAGEPFLAAFEHGNVLPRTGQPRCGDTRAIARPDHQDRIVGFRLIQAFRDALLHGHSAASRRDSSDVSSRWRTRASASSTMRA